ncbi:hypothetical protein GCK72_007391 [Caenorhabditis remanei]|uniref:BTB domain-containing protein n=1 Tax=Caenorhabditis remanei TaxID=31234 RepID=A0A6A5HNQ9_CAERE|nr:hypothetical protein GCK72_007391 [Caenorhabditis remanei]KAF1767432.1 hypothetical protein GCK72_007391 [Caenorhabditis remanei]
MPSAKKEFTLTHVFENVETEEFDFFTDEEKHYNVFWNLNLCQYNGNVEFYIISSLTDDGSVAGSVDSDWSEPDGEEYCVETELDIKLTFADGKKIEEKRKVVFKTGDDSMHEFMCIPWSDLTRECSVDGKVKLEVRVKILKATGTETKKLMSFDEAMKDFSDAVLVVKKEKFYISKLFLAYQSSYFKSLLLGGFKESEKSEIVLKDIDPEDFQKFLEVLYGEDAVDDDTVEGIVHLADMYDAPKALKRCEQFLMKKSRKSLKSKLELSAKYNMDGVKNKCLGDIKTVADIQSVLPENLEEMNHSLMASVLRKAMSHLVHFTPMTTMSTLKKEFSMPCTFKKVPNVENSKNYSSFSKQEDHYNFLWRLSLKEADQKAVVRLHLTEPKDASDFSVETECYLTVFDVDGMSDTERFTYKFKPGDDNFGMTFSSWKRLARTYLINGEIEVEAHVKILNISRFENKKLKVFDESMKQFSDIVLVAGEEKFYVSKLFLASHSTYFNSLLLGKFDESKKSEVNLKDIDPGHFQKFLEVLHGEDAINDSTVEGIVRLADMYDAPTAHRRCEQFMMKESEKSLKEKLELSARYKMIRVKNKCLSEIKTAKDIKSVVPENIDEMDPSLTAAILKKAISHLK